MGKKMGGQISKNHVDTKAYKIVNPGVEKPVIKNASVLTGGKNTLRKIESPKFTFAHALYNDGIELRMYKVIGVYSHKGSQIESLRLQDVKTGLTLKGLVRADMVRGARVVNPKS